jgi:uncharacterized protein GlcG (DUF336 family)
MHPLTSLSGRVLAIAAAGAVLLAACGEDTTGPEFEPLADRSPLARLLPSHDVIRSMLQEIVAEQNGGLGFQMWASLVDRDGLVVDVAFTGVNRDDQWPGSRVISAQKANTANAFSLDGLALSTANLFAAVQPGGSLFGLQDSNPVDPEVAYGGNPRNYGTNRDPMIGERIGGINVFGGGLALYDPDGNLLGALGVSGDTSCTDHIIGWKLRHALNLDNIPGGVSPTGDDNIIFIQDELDGFEHATCFDTPGRGDHIEIAENLPNTHPVGPFE